MHRARPFVALLAFLVALFAPRQAVAAAHPEVVGRVIPADSGSVAGLRVYLRGAGVADSAEVDSAGNFRLAVPAGRAGDTLELAVDAADSAFRRYHPSVVRLRRGALNAEHRFVMVPLEWTIPHGAYAGARVPIELHRAFRPVCRDCSSFYRRGSENPRSGAARDLVRTWPEAAFPLRVAFDREFSVGATTARDSAAFWSAADEMEHTFGRDLFRPARFAEAVPQGEEFPNDAIFVQVDPSLHASGLGISSAYGNEIVYGEVRVKEWELVHESDGPHLVTHELLHAMGFGHTCSWRSAMAVAARCPSMRSPVLSREDVAYAQLAQRVRQLQQTHEARWGMEAALEGERMYLLAAGAARARS